MLFRQKLAFFVFGCVFVVVGQVVTGVVVPSATAQDGPQDAGADTMADVYRPLVGSRVQTLGHKLSAVYVLRAVNEDHILLDQTKYGRVLIPMSRIMLCQFPNKLGKFGEVARLAVESSQ